MQLFVLVSAPEEHLIVNVSRQATVQQTKAAIERKRGWPCWQQRLWLEGGRELEEGRTLSSYKVLKKAAHPTLCLWIDVDGVAPAMDVPVKGLPAPRIRASPYVALHALACPCTPLHNIPTHLRVPLHMRAACVLTYPRVPTSTLHARLHSPHRVTS